MEQVHIRDRLAATLRVGSARSVRGSRQTSVALVGIRFPIGDAVLSGRWGMFLIHNRFRPEITERGPMPAERHRMRIVDHTINADASRIGTAIEGATVEEVCYIRGETELQIHLRKGKRIWVLGLKPEGEDGGPGWVELAGPWRDGVEEDSEGPYPLHEH